MGSKGCPIFALWNNKLTPHNKQKMTTEQKNNLLEEFNILWVNTNAEVTNHFPTIYSKSDIQFILKNLEIKLDNMLRRIETSEETTTEVSEQKYTLAEIREAIESLDFDNSDFCTLEVNEWGNECKIEAGICTHEIEDYVQNDIIEFLNNIEK